MTTGHTSHPGALSGIRVLDLSRVLAGPTCAQMLADLGADVIKVERPGVGDETRQWGPPWLADENGDPTGESSYYLCANRGKRSITVDMNAAEGLDVLRRLASESDIVVENFKVGSLAKKGLGYDDIRAINPTVIYASITGFGLDGPMASQPGYDYLAQAMGGLMSITGRPDGEPGGGPLRSGIAVADQSAGLFSVIGILAALRHRDQTGEGQQVDVSLLDSQLAVLVNQALNYFVGGTPPTRSGEWHPNLAPYQPFDVSDGRVVIAVGNNGQFAALCEWLGVPEMIDDPRFANNPDRNKHRVEMAGTLQAKFRTRTRAETLAGLPPLGVPAATINDIAEAFDDPHVRHRGGRIELPHPLAGTAPAIANPIHFSGSPITYRNAPPLLGEHTDEVLVDVLGLTEAEIEALRVAGVL
ncbi:MAG: CaiB/BaiF CoA-transferase family protein [Acidimicrobiia bacterium]|nr:CaiB/BaiF CoA-transferase family protein [Acidimicrobiia bacterium]